MYTLAHPLAICIYILLCHSFTILFLLFFWFSRRLQETRSFTGLVILFTRHIYALYDPSRNKKTQ